MACPTCGHTMQKLGTVMSSLRLFWCQRCGTFLSRHYNGDEDKLIPTTITDPAVYREVQQKRGVEAEVPPEEE